MRLLVNHQPFPFPMRLKSASFEQSYYERSHSNFTVFSSFFDVKKQKPKTDLEKYYQCSIRFEISLDLKVCFSLVTYKINNLIALRSTNQITEISAP